VAGREAAVPAGGALEFGDDGGFRLGVLRLALPPLATARAAAASAGLAAPRTGAAELLDGAGVATVGPDADAAAGRALLDCGAGRLLPDPVEPDDPAGRPLPEPAEEGALEAGAAVGAEAEGWPVEDDPPAGREGTAVGRPVAGREEPGASAGALVTDGGAATVGLSGRAAGRTRVSSAAPSVDPAVVTCGDASVLIGTVPPPEFCRDALSERWLLSELTPTPPCSSSRRGTVM